ncbi:HAD-IA family hydrolase [Aureimonas fodinaquatilis]|nr:HAD-IA family hydrolase [Aureimonas fodinaquatilis]
MSALQSTDFKHGIRPIAVFDLDGTLVDTAPDLTASLNHCLHLHGMAPVCIETVRPFAGHGSRAMLRAAYGWANTELPEDMLERHVENFLTYYEANIAVGSTAFPGAVEALDRLSQAGFTLAVCTNKSERLAKVLLDSLGLSTRFAAICGYDSFPARKPDPRHLGGTIAQAGAEHSSSVMIGDTVTDMEAARNLGIASVLMSFGYDANEQARAMATKILPTYDDLTAKLLLELMDSAGSGS